jgi:exosortase/archaeosortase family protein
MTAGTHAAPGGLSRPFASSSVGERRRQRKSDDGARRAVRSHRRPRVLGRRVTSLGLVGIAAMLLFNAREVRVAEAWIQWLLLQAAGIESHHVGTVVLIEAQDRWVGVSLTAGCSVGPMLAIFLTACAPFVWYRSMSVVRVMGAVLQLAAVLVLANEVRIAAIVGAMRIWGVERGYDMSHVFLGSAITTVGFVVGLVLFMRLFVARPKGGAA